MGTIFASIAFANLAIMNALVKETSQTASVPVIIFFQNFLCFLAILPIALYRGWEEIKTTRIGLHFIRAATGTGAWIGLFLAFKLMPLTNAVLLTYSAPIWMPLIAWVLQGQQTKNSVWISVIIGFMGITLVLHPTTTSLNWGAPLALTAAILLALALMSIRWLNKTEPNIRILFYFFLLSSLIILPIALLNWQVPTPLNWIYLFGIASCLLLSQTFLIIAYKYASAVTLAPIIYTIILFTALINWVVWDQVPTLVEALGMILIILGGLIAIKSDALTTKYKNID